MKCVESNYEEARAEVLTHIKKIEGGSGAVGGLLLAVGSEVIEAHSQQVHERMF